MKSFKRYVEEESDLPISEEAEENEEVRYTIYVVKNGSDVIWKKKVRSTERLTLQQIASNLPKENADQRYDTIRITSSDND